MRAALAHAPRAGHLLDEVQAPAADLVAAAGTRDGQEAVAVVDDLAAQHVAGLAVEDHADLLALAVPDAVGDELRQQQAGVLEGRPVEV